MSRSRVRRADEAEQKSSTRNTNEHRRRDVCHELGIQRMLATQCVQYAITHDGGSERRHERLEAHPADRLHFEREHCATSTIELKASPAQVWNALTDWRQFPQWRKDLKSIEEFTAPDGGKGWVETSDWGRMPLVVERADGSLLVDGSLPVDELREIIGQRLPHLDDHDYHTAAGMAIAHFGRIPNTGEYFDWSGWRIEVIDLDGPRIDKLLLTRIESTGVDDDT